MNINFVLNIFLYLLQITDIELFPNTYDFEFIFLFQTSEVSKLFRVTLIYHGEQMLL